MTGHGNVHFSHEETQTLRRYLEQGGLLHDDDDYGIDKSVGRAAAVLLASAGGALAIAGAGVALAPSIAAVLGAWLLIGGVTVLAARSAFRAGRHAAAPAVGRLVEAATGGRPGSIVGLVAP